MFEATGRIPMQLGSANLQLERVKKGEEQYPIAILGLAFELNAKLAKELGEDIKEHCYTRHNAVRAELKTVTLSIPGPLQQVTVWLVDAGNTEPHTTLRQAACKQVRISRIVRKKKGKEDGSKLLATLQVRIDFREKDAREFLAKRFGQRLFWTFSDEQMELGLEPPAEGDEGEQAKKPKKVRQFGRPK